jgi:hypothetical protein
LAEERVSLRYGVPGFSFLIVVILANWKSIMELITDIQGANISGPILAAFLAFVGGIPTGFLISQFYWLIFHLVGGYEWTDRKALKRLEEFGVKPKYSLEVFDYIIHRFEKKGIRAYIDRRWTIIHTVASTITSLILATFVGLFVIPSALGKHPEHSGLILLITVISMGLMAFSVLPIKSEINKMYMVIVEKNKDRLKEFPKSYFCATRNVAKKDEENEKKRDTARLWMLGILLGVVGNMLVSANVEMVGSSGVTKLGWLAAFILSFLVFMFSFRESAEILDLPTRPIVVATKVFLVFMLVWTLIIFFVLPLI